MFKTSLLSSASRIDEIGQYHSPNICFITPDEDDLDGGPNDQDDDEADEEGSVADEGEDQDGDEGEVDPDHQEIEDAEGARQEVAQREEAPRRKGASDVIRENKRRAKEAEERYEGERRAREAAERRADAAERAQQERRQTETAEQERARLDLMTPEEKYEYRLQKQSNEQRSEIQQLRFDGWNRDDKADFRDLVREDPLVAKVKDKVEARFAEIQRSGAPPVSRAILADLEVGRMVREQRKASGTKQRNRGAEAVRRETTRPVRARSEAAAPQRARRGQEDTPEARRRRLADVTI